MKTTNKLLLVTAMAVSFVAVNRVQAISDADTPRDIIDGKTVDNMRETSTLKTPDVPNKMFPDDFQPQSDNAVQYHQNTQKMHKHAKSFKKEATDSNYAIENKTGYSATCHDLTASPKVFDMLRQSPSNFEQPAQ